MFTYSKDDRHTIVGTGIVTPAILFLMLLWQFIAGRVWIPEPNDLSFGIFRRIHWHCFTPSDWGFWFIAAAEWGLIFACLGWYCFANIKQLEWLARPTVIVGYVGLIITAVGVLISLYRQFC